MTADRPDVENQPTHPIPDASATSALEDSSLSADAAPSLAEILSRNPRLALVAGSLALVLLCFVGYLPSLRGEFLWLDDVSVTDNPYLRTWNGIQHFWTSADPAGRYEPLSLTTFWLGYRFWHYNPIGYHVTNTVFHLLVAMLLWTLLRRLSLPGAWAAAAIFALHPLHAQAVAWISGRGVVLATLFYLAALIVYLRYSGLTPAAPGAHKTFSLPQEPERLWGLAMVLFACAVLSNAVAITFPLTILLVLWWKRGRITRPESFALFPFIALGLAAGIATALLQNRAPAAHTLEMAFPLPAVADQLLYAPRAIGSYALKVFAPSDLLFDYPRWSPDPVASTICLIGIVLTLIVLWMFRSRLGRGAFVAVALFAISVIPVLGLVDAPALRYAFVADRLAYLPSIFLIVLIVVAVARGAEALVARNVATPSASGILTGMALVGLFILTWRQGLHYATSQALWVDILQKDHNHNSLLAADNYGELLLHNRDGINAEAWFEKAHRVAPRDPHAIFDLGVIALAHAAESQALNQPAEAAAYRATAETRFKESVDLDPGFAAGHVALGRIDEARKDDQAAADEFAKAVASSPENIRARLELGAVLHRLRKDPQAEQELYDLIDIAPDFPSAHSELGNVFLAEQREPDALTEWKKAVDLDSLNTTVLVNFGGLLASGDHPNLPAAARQFAIAIQIDPTLGDAYFNLGKVELKLGRRQDAVIHLHRAVDLEPENQSAKDALADALDQLKRLGPGTRPSTAATQILPPLN